MQLPNFGPDFPPPTSPRVYNVALAIAHAEGAFVPGSVPATRNNPGALTDENGIIHYPDVNLGWRALIAKVEKMAAGESKVYKPTMTFAQIADLYVAGGKTPHPGDKPRLWAEIVAGWLGVPVTVTLADYLGLQVDTEAAPAAPAPVEVTPGSIAQE